MASSRRFGDRDPPGSRGLVPQLVGAARSRTGRTVREEVPGGRRHPRQAAVARMRASRMRPAHNRRSRGPPSGVLSLVRRGEAAPSHECGENGRDSVKPQMREIHFKPFPHMCDGYPARLSHVCGNPPAGCRTCARTRPPAAPTAGDNAEKVMGPRQAGEGPRRGRRPKKTAQRPERPAPSVPRAGSDVSATPLPRIKSGRAKKGLSLAQLEEVKTARRGRKASGSNSTRIVRGLHAPTFRPRLVVLTSSIWGRRLFLSHAHADEFAGVGMLGTSQHLVRGALLHDLAAPHHQDTLAESLHESQVVTDEEIGDAACRPHVA